MALPDEACGRRGAPHATGVYIKILLRTVSPFDERNALPDGSAGRSSNY